MLRKSPQVYSTMTRMHACNAALRQCGEGVYGDKQAKAGQG